MILTEIINSIGQVSLDLLSESGYWGVWWLSFLDRVLLSVVPSEVVLPLIGFLTGQGRFGLWPVIFLTTVGNLAGDAVLYWISLWGGRPLLDKHGRKFFISKHELEHTDSLFQKHGGKLVVIGRLLPIARTFVAIPAGISRMPLGKFILYTIIGSLPYNIFLILLGLKSGENWQAIKPIFDRLNVWILLAVILLAVWYVIRHQRRKHISH